jgi:hypothetical protein
LLARLSELHNLARKHTCQITELITTKGAISTALDAIDGTGTSLHGLQQQKEVLAQKYHEQAKVLSKIRLEKSNLLSNLVTEAMQVLGMPGSGFKVDLPKLIPTSTSSKIKVGVYSLSLLTTEIAKEIRESSPPDATFFRALKSLQLPLLDINTYACKKHKKKRVHKPQLYPYLTISV